MPGPNWPRLLLRATGRRLPLTRGRVRVAGLRSDVVIRRDRWGIPHVDAATDTDAWFALGFCHAQDRAFQIEILVRVGRGTLAELIGPEALPLDRMSRRLGFRRVATRQESIIDGDVRATLAAYAAGVNAGLTDGLPRRPHEFLLLRAHPTPWTVLDVLAFVGLQAFSLSSNWDSELARLRILSTDGPDALRALDPTYPAWLPVTSPVGGVAGATIDRLAEDLEILRGTTSGGGGSNNWAIAGSRTVSGKPIVANDPHLAPRLPAPWYLAHLRTPEWSMSGASFVGGPAFPIGTNGFAAWGITAGLTDATDLFLEEIGPDGISVREGGEFVPCEVITERIAVKGAPTQELQVLVTRRGPVVTAGFVEPAVVGTPGDGGTTAEPPQALSFSAIYLQPLPLRGFLDVVRARSFEAFRSAFAEWPGPALNVVYGDLDGHVGWQLVGQVPRRRRGWGTIPLPGWDPAVGWETELVPFAEMPHLTDPPTGFVATANNQPTADGTEPFLGFDWFDGYRLGRILEVLATHDRWDVAASQQLQVDVGCLPWLQMRDAVLGLATHGHPDAERAHHLLASWDGRISEDAPAASVYELFVAALSRRLAEARAPGAWPWALGAGFGPIVPQTLFGARAAGRVVRLLRDRPEGWFPGSTWHEQAVAALGDAVGALRHDHGDDPAQWAWGKLRTLTLEHPVGGRQPLGRIFNIGPVPFGGDSSTPMQAGSGPLNPFANVGFLANTRCVMDLADPSASRFVLAGGQSGNPLSPHYRDLFELWLRGEGVPIAVTEVEVAAATIATLRLAPADSTRQDDR
jgi:penicillin amidase